MIASFSKKKFLFISWESLSGDLAWSLKKEGHEVKCYIRSKSDTDVYQGFLERVQDWKKWVKWADVIVFDDVYFGRQADRLRKIGKFVIGGSKYTDALETDREFGQEELLKRGIGILPHWNFKNYDKAIKFIKKHPARYVFKPSENGGYATDTSLMFLGQDENGQDLLDLLEQNKDVWKKKAPVFQLQKYISGVEIAVGAFFNGQDFIYPINVNFEHKRLFPGDLGPFTGEMGCYDKKTEVLTKNGWKFFKDLEYNDEIATLDSKLETLKYEKPTKIVKFGHHKKMVQIKNRAIDIFVTLDHNMFVQKRNHKTWEFVSAKSINGTPLKIKRTANWIGNDYDIDQARFLGIYLAEGSVSKPRKRAGGYQIVISATNPKKSDKIKSILDQTKYKWKRDKRGWYLYDKKLYEKLLKFGKSYEKFTPQEIKNSNKIVIKAFLDAYALGDATMMRGGWRIFYTSSQRMSDDIQELLLKIGRVGVIKSRNRFGKKIWIQNHWTEQKHNAFEIIERIKKIYSYLDKRDLKIVNYKGTVYCATVSSHVMYVRRNGKPYWCGNTLMYWDKPINPIFTATLEKMKPALIESGYHGYIDLNCIVTGKGIYPLEFTTRFGYPTIPIQLEGITMSTGEWLYKLAKGEQFELKVKKGFQIGVRIMVPTYFADERDKAIINTYRDLPILFKKLDYEGVHIEDVKLVDETWRVAGSSGCLLVVTGSGTTVDEARKRVYRRLGNINIQNMFYRVDIGTRWFHDSDKLQTWGYL